MAMNVSCLHSNLKNPAQCNSPLNYTNMVVGPEFFLHEENIFSFRCNCVCFHPTLLLFTPVKDLKKSTQRTIYFRLKLMGEKTLRKTLTWTCLRFPHAGLQGEEHGPHAAGHRGAAEEQQQRLRLRPDGYRPDCHLPLVGAARLLQGPGGLQGGREEAQAEEDR